MKQTNMERNEAIGRLRLLYSATNAENKAALECLIPELKESEDERIRKFLVEVINKYAGVSTKEKERCLAYLEKQEEQKPAEWNEKDVVMFSKLLFSLQTLVFPCDQERKEIMSWLKSLFHKHNLKPIPSVRKII